MLADRTIGPDAPKKKTMGVRNSREIATQAGFNYPPNSAFTSEFFREFIGRSGAQGEKWEKAESLIHGTPIKKSEKDALIAEYNRFPKNGFASPYVYVRADEPWSGSLGLGSSDKAADSGDLLYAVKATLASQFHPDVLAYKALKGITGEFGVLLMQAYVNFRSDHPSFSCPTASVNFLGKINRQVLLQYTTGFYGLTKAEGKHLFERQFHFRRKEHLLYGFDHRASRLVALGGPCSIEAVRSMVGGKDTWTCVQYEKHPIQSIVPPAVDKNSILYSGERVVGTAVAATEDVVLCAEPEELFETNAQKAARYERFAAYNRDHKGYLFLADVGRVVDISKIPLDAYSNAGAVVLYVTLMQRESASHLNGLMRDLGMPFIIIEYNIFSNQERKAALYGELKKGGKFIVYANEFSENGPEGFIARA